MDGRFALWFPGKGWWSGRGESGLEDMFCDDLVDACVLTSESAAAVYASAIGDRLGGAASWIYQVYSVRRPLGRRF